VGNWHYIKTPDNKFQLIDSDGEKIAEPIEKLSFLIDANEETSTLLKHGDHDKVEIKLKSYDKAYRDAGLTDMANDLMLIDVSNVDLEEVNKCIAITGYINNFIRAIKNSQTKQIDG